MWLSVVSERQGCPCRCDNVRIRFQQKDLDTDEWENVDPSGQVRQDCSPTRPTWSHCGFSRHPPRGCHALTQRCACAAGLRLG